MISLHPPIPMMVHHGQMSLTMMLGMRMFSRSSTFLAREPPCQECDNDGSSGNANTEADLCVAA